MIHIISWLGFSVGQSFHRKSRDYTLSGLEPGIGGRFGSFFVLTGVILTVAVFQAEGRISRADLRQLGKTLLLPLV
jgi:hypothetical protein